MKWIKLNIPMPSQFINRNGSEFDVVILPLTQAAPMLLTKNLLYTAMTRAKKLLIVIGSSSIIQFVIQNTEVKKRNTGLKYKLEKLGD